MQCVSRYSGRGKCSKKKFVAGREEVQELFVKVGVALLVGLADEYRSQAFIGS